MKKVVSGVVKNSGWTVPSGGSGTWLDIAIPLVVGPPRGTKVEISWDEPGPKTHECLSDSRAMRVFYSEIQHVWRCGEIGGVAYTIEFCPYCGEKLEGAQ